DPVLLPVRLAAAELERHQGGPAGPAALPAARARGLPLLASHLGPRRAGLRSRRHPQRHDLREGPPPATATGTGRPGGGGAPCGPDRADVRSARGTPVTLLQVAVVQAAPALFAAVARRQRPGAAGRRRLAQVRQEQSAPRERSTCGWRHLVVCIPDIAD